MMNENILDEQQFEILNGRRRDLLPLWIKVFTWIFLIFGATVPVVFVLGIIGINFNLSLYGLETTEPLSLIGILLTILFAIKGIVAFGLWTQKEWAVSLAIIDAIIGIIICLSVTVILPVISENDGINLSFGLELVALIPYLIKMRSIKAEWKE